MKRLLLASALRGCAIATCALPLVAHGQSVGTLYGFGDSLSDDGNLPKYLHIDYPPPPYYDNHFSNGPVFLEYLPGLTGLSFSSADDYAVGGAFANSGSLLGSAVPGVSLQIADAAAAGLRFSPYDVVSVWAGANNYFALLGSVPQNATIGNATVQSAIHEVAGALTGDVAAVIGLGARRVVVFNVPNLGITPAYNDNPQSLLATEITEQHNAILPADIAALQKSTGVNIYYINAFQGLEEIIQDPGRLGITNTTQECILVPACVNGSRAVQNTFLFWDDVHPTTGVQEFLAEVVSNQLNAELTVAGQGQLVLAETQDFATGIAQRLAARRAADPDSGQAQVWLQGHYTNGSRDTVYGADGFKYDAGALLAGIDYWVTNQLLVGGAFGWGRPNADFGGGAGKLAYNAYQGGLYASWRDGGAFADATATYGRFATSTAWRASLPGEAPLTFTPDANAYGITLGGGYMFTEGALLFGPVAGLSRTHVDIDSYTENGEPLVTQRVNGQGVDSMVGRIGISATYGAGLAPWLPRPTVSLAAERELLDGSRTVTSSFLGAGLPINTSLPGYGGIYGTVDIGVSEAFTPALSGIVDFETTFGRADGTDRAVLVKLAGSF